MWVGWMGGKGWMGAHEWMDEGGVGRLWSARATAVPESAAEGQRRSRALQTLLYTDIEPHCPSHLALSCSTPR